MSERDNQLLGPMAAFIGARLQYPNPHINGQGNPWVSTILVEQHKEKCWYIRVYCKLAHESLVRKKWQWLKDNKDTFKGPSRFMPNIDVSAAEPTREFYARCVKRDAMHYREVYRDMVTSSRTSRRRSVVKLTTQSCCTTRILKSKAGFWSWLSTTRPASTGLRSSVRGTTSRTSTS